MPATQILYFVRVQLSRQAGDIPAILSLAAFISVVLGWAMVVS